MNEPPQDDSMLVLESNKRVIDASIVIALIGLTLVVFLFHSLSIKRTTDELIRSRATLRSLEGESIRLSSETQKLRQRATWHYEDAIRDFLKGWRDADDIPDFNSSRIITDYRTDGSLWHAPSGDHRLEITISKDSTGFKDPITGTMPPPGPLPPPSAETVKVWTVPLVGGAGYHFRVILHSNRRQLTWNLSSNSPNFSPRTELIQSREANKLETLPYFSWIGARFQTLTIPNEISEASDLRLNDGKSEEEMLAELKKLLETPSGVILYIRRFIAPKVANGKDEVTYVVARLVSDGPARIAPSDAKKLIQSVDCQDLIEPHIYTEPYIYDESFEASNSAGY